MLKWIFIFLFSIKKENEKFYVSEMEMLKTK